MISVAEALKITCGLVSPLDTEYVPLTEAVGRVLSQNVKAARDQPPFDSSAMDGYAVVQGAVRPGGMLRVIGESAAGRAYPGDVGKGEAVRIFTGAPVPSGTGRIIIQEDVQRDGDLVRLSQSIDEKNHIRLKGDDFRARSELTAPRVLGPGDIALLAAMNVARVPVARKPDVAVLSTGDELVMPGEDPGPDRIVASNCFGLKALLDSIGASARILPIARDTVKSLQQGFGRARGADLIVTSGGASVGDRDLVAQATGELGIERVFHKVAMRPGKPLMAGKVSGIAMIGLPGNPVSSMVCGHVFVLPMIRKMVGLPYRYGDRPTAPLRHPISANGPREHYMRGRIDDGELTVFDRQDSALLSILSRANALIVRPPYDAAREAGNLLEYIPV